MNIQYFDYSIDILQCVLWQYNQATNLLRLLQDKQDWLDVNQSAFWGEWYTNVFDLRTANEFGLAVWSIILNVPLFLKSDQVQNTQIFGFNYYLSGTTGPLANDYLNFGGFDNNPDTISNFSNLDTQINLTVEEQRFLLRLRYFQLVTNGALAKVAGQNIEDINDFLNYLCTDNLIGYDGTIYALDNLNMTMTYVLTTTDFPSALLNAIETLDLFPRPAGVEYVREFLIDGNLLLLNDQPFLLLNGNNFVFL